MTTRHKTTTIPAATSKDRLAAAIRELAAAGELHPTHLDGEVIKLVDTHLRRQGLRVPGERTMRRYLPRLRPIWRTTPAQR